MNRLVLHALSLIIMYSSTNSNFFSPVSFLVRNHFLVGLNGFSRLDEAVVPETALNLGTECVTGSIGTFPAGDLDARSSCMR